MNLPRSPWMRVAGYILGLLFVGCAGCSRQGPDRPDFEPSSAGSQAIEQYDTDGSGHIDRVELGRIPALKGALERVDTDRDGTISAEEISARVEYFESAQTILLDGSCIVELDGKPLVGATVTFEPEALMGSDLKSVSGVTDSNGYVFLKDPAARFPGIYLGLYRVRISKVKNGRETIPAKYNTESELGYEAADDIPDVSDVIRFSMTSN